FRMDHNVNFFATCMGSTALQDSVISSIKLMQMYGAKIIFKKKQTCCGQPAFNSGYTKEAKEIAFYNMALFGDNNYPIVIPAGSCAGMMSHDYKLLFKDDSQEVRDSVERFASRIYDESEYLDQVLQAKFEDKGQPIKVTFHVSCHSLRVQECIPTQKSLIRQLQNVTLVDIPYEEECCGFGGTFSIKEPEISNAIVSEKIKHIQETGCKVVLAGDNGCILNISGALARKGITDIKVMNIYDFILKRLTGEEL
ncbi:(Fe-S)-binding protein, partial [Anaerobiospirillum sp. NML120448]|uniref:(Fe-S)-binding protein n=1 Tax=Anaerobiospirillum sp. NML120448 TaxID=2932816 RepID=UPI001FF1AD1E